MIFFFNNQRVFWVHKIVIFQDLKYYRRTSKRKWLAYPFLKNTATCDFPAGMVVKNLPADVGNTRDTGSIPSQEDPLEENSAPVFLPGKFHGLRNLAGYVHGVKKSHIWLSHLHHHCKVKATLECCCITQWVSWRIYRLDKIKSKSDWFYGLLTFQNLRNYG